MAWISLIAVVSIFFTPGIGIAPQRIGEDLIATIPVSTFSIAFTVPGTGSLRLLGECVFIWLAVWLILYLPDRWLGENALRDKKPYRDFLNRIGIWNDMVTAYRPTVSLTFTVWLAKLILWFMAVKFLLGYLLQIVAEKFLPSLISWAVSQFGGNYAFLQPLLQQVAQDLIHFGLDVAGISLIVASILILIANRAFTSERNYRHRYAILQAQNKIRKEQSDIVIPVTQL